MEIGFDPHGAIERPAVILPQNLRRAETLEMIGDELRVEQLVAADLQPGL